MNVSRTSVLLSQLARTRLGLILANVCLDTNGKMMSVQVISFSLILYILNFSLLGDCPVNI